MHILSYQASNLFPSQLKAYDDFGQFSSRSFCSENQRRREEVSSPPADYVGLKLEQRFESELVLPRNVVWICCRDLSEGRVSKRIA